MFVYHKEWNPEQCLEDLFTHKRHILLHGPGGCGKSYFLQNTILPRLDENKIVYMVTSTTGISASSIQGTTIHKFLGYSYQTGDDIGKWIGRLKTKGMKSVVQKMQKTKVLMIDEISMMGAQFLDTMNVILQWANQSTLLFGGIQCIWLGDFYQLPPIQDGYVFESKVWREMALTMYEMTELKRYTDEHYAQMLLRIRTNQTTTDDIIDLSNRKVAYMEKEWKKWEPILPTILYGRKTDIDALNTKYMNETCDPTSEKQFMTKILILDTYIPEVVVEEKRVKQKNMYDFFGGSSSKPIEKKVVSSIKRKTKEEVEQNINEKFPPVFTLRVGAQVMLTVNINVEKGLVNGSRGVVIGYKLLEEYIPIVQWSNGYTTNVQPYEWEWEDDFYLIKVCRLPLTLAWCMTIHKSQGMTLDVAICKLGSDIFSPHQVYVALSRVKSMDGLYLEEWNPRKIRVDSRVIEFFESIENQ